MHQFVVDLVFNLERELQEVAITGENILSTNKQTMNHTQSVKFIFFSM